MTFDAAWLAALVLRSLLVIGAAAVVAACLQRQSAAARHAVWAGALVALVALPALSVAMPRIRVPVPAAAARAEFVGPDATQPSAQAESHMSGSAQLPPPSTGTRGAAASRRMTLAVIALWLCGALMLVYLRLLSEVRSRRVVRAARPARAELARLCALESARLGFRDAPSLLSSADVPVPATAGILRPVVLLPVEADAWGAADATAALVHELGHIRRRDGLLNLIGDVATAVCWFNPAMWLARARMRAESERACDDLVLIRGTDPEGYAALLLREARRCRDGGLPSAMTAMARAHQLETRLRAVLDDRVRRRAPAPRMAAALGAWGLVVALPACSLTFRTDVTQGAAAALEPDRAGDAIALPGSERLPAVTDGWAVPAGAAAALLGPDSALVARLITALAQPPQHDADLVRDRAAWALAQTRDGRLVEPLLGALHAPDWRVQSYAAWALVTARDPRAVPPLIELLGHPVWRLRAMAAAALRESADTRAIEAMSTALGDAAWQVRLEAVGYFLSFGTPDMTERVSALRNDRHIAVRMAIRDGTSSP